MTDIKDLLFGLAVLVVIMLTGPGIKALFG